MLALGFTEDAIRRRVDDGVLFRVHRGVYAVAGTRDSLEFRVMGAVLAAGEGAVASGRCAAALFDLRRIRCDVPEVTVSGRRAPRIDAFRSHRRDVLTAADRTRIGVIPVTAPAWTLLDLAADGVELMRVGGALDDVLVRKLASLRTAERVVARALGLHLPGAALLAELVDERQRGVKPSATGLEDEARDQRAGLIGWTVKRYSTEDIRERPAGIAEEVRWLRRGAEGA